MQIADVHLPDVVTIGEDTFNVGAFAPADTGVSEYGDLWRQVRSPVGPVNLEARRTPGPSVGSETECV